jgi:hypothetical protein
VTQAVPTEGFTAPPAAGNPAQAPVTGFPPPPAANPAPAAQPAAPAQPGNPDLTAAIAALTSALGTQQPAAEPEVSVAGGLNTYDVDSIDDPILKSMATVLKTVGKGVDLDRAIGRAISEGRTDLIDVAYLREKGGANANDLITIAQGLVQAVQAKGAAVTDSVHKLAGGEAQWDAGVAAFNAQAPRELRMVVAQMLDSNKEDLIQAGAKLVVEFSKSSGAIPNVGATVATGASSLPAAQALSKLEFQDELRKLNPQDRSYEEQRKTLFARRSLGRQLNK